jgi:hypothetical protein
MLTQRHHQRVQVQVRRDALTVCVIFHSFEVFVPFRFGLSYALTRTVDSSELGFNTARVHAYSRCNVFTPTRTGVLFYAY